MTREQWAFDCLFQEVDFDGNVVFNFSSLEQGISVSETLFGTSDDISAENRKSFRHSNALHYGLLTSAKHMTVGAPDLRSVIGHLIALELIDCHIVRVH